MTKAGWASCDITPPLGLPMGGRGPRFAAGTEVVDPLEAFATILEDDNGQRVVLLSLDLVGIGLQQSERLCYQIAAALGTNPQSVIINASHTHSGPMMAFEQYATLKPKPPEMLQYEQTLDERLLRLAIDASKNLQEVQIFWRDGSSEIGINRRVKTSEGVVMAPNSEGHYHRQLWTLELKPTDSKSPGCVLFSHACHPVILYGCQWTSISSEWPGRARRALRAELGEGVHCQFMQGLAGNIRPRILADFENQKFRTSVPEDVELTGQQIAKDVLRTLEQDAQPLQLKLGAARGWFMARRGEAKPREHWEELQRSDDELSQEVGKYWLTRFGENAISPYQAQPFPIGIVHFTPEHALVYTAGEPLCEWYEIFQKALPNQKLVACGYTHASASYLPTDALLDEGGYEIDRSPQFSRSGPGVLQPGLDEAVTESLHRLHASIDAE
jgi:hypothetical protein